MKITLYSDGGSRGNPGEAAIGYVIKKDKEIIYKRGETIGVHTNNYAEYMALLKGVKKAIDMGASALDIYLDSELIVKQIKGEYKVKKEDLKIIYNDVLKELKSLKDFSITHIKREFNKEADKALNIALDTKEIYEISFLEEISSLEINPKEKIEKEIHERGFEDARLNFHEDLVRITISNEKIEDFLRSDALDHAKIELKMLGYKHITLDLS